MSKIHSTEEGDVISCDSCQCEVPTEEYDWGPPYGEKHEQEKRFLCDFCAGSYVGNITRHSPRDTEGYLRKETAVLLAQAVNHLKSSKDEAILARLDDEGLVKKVVREWSEKGKPEVAKAVEMIINAYRKRVKEG